MYVCMSRFAIFIHSNSAENQTSRRILVQKSFFSNFSPYFVKLHVWLEKKNLLHSLFKSFAHIHPQSIHPTQFCSSVQTHFTLLSIFSTLPSPLSLWLKVSTAYHKHWSKKELFQTAESRRKMANSFPPSVKFLLLLLHMHILVRRDIVCAARLLLLR